MARRPLQEINAGSMADIAFLLLIFFLVTTTMDQDIGILRQLPPPVDDNVTPPEVNRRNVYDVLVNSADRLLVKGQPVDIRNLKEGAKEFYTNPTNRMDLPELRRINRSLCVENIAQLKAAIAQQPDNREMRDRLAQWEDRLAAVELVGEYRELPSSALISLQNDRGTSYDMYIRVQNELSAAINELRNELSMEKFNVPYASLNILSDEDKPKIKAIRAVYPQRISEAEPKNVGGI
jgi:biopolymer transport protein ExbD